MDGPLVSLSRRWQMTWTDKKGLVKILGRGKKYAGKLVEEWLD